MSKVNIPLRGSEREVVISNYKRNFSGERITDLHSGLRAYYGVRNKDTNFKFRGQSSFLHSEQKVFIERGLDALEASRKYHDEDGSVTYRSNDRGLRTIDCSINLKPKGTLKNSKELDLKTARKLNIGDESRIIYNNATTLSPNAGYNIEIKPAKSDDSKAFPVINISDNIARDEFTALSHAYLIARHASLGFGLSTVEKDSPHFLIFIDENENRSIEISLVRQDDDSILCTVINPEPHVRVSQDGDSNFKKLPYFQRSYQDERKKAQATFWFHVIEDSPFWRNS